MELNGHEVELTTLRDIIRARAELGDKPLAVVDDETITFAEADERSNRVANWLAGVGVEKGDVVATYMYNSVDHIAAWFGCAKIGAIWAPLNIALVNVDLAYTIDNAKPKVLIADAELHSNFAKIRGDLTEPPLEVVRGETSDEGPHTPLATLFEASSEEPEAHVEISDPAGIIYTGGSTGMPKGVVVANGWYLPAAVRYDEMFEVRPGDVHMGVGQMCHAIGSAVDVLCPMYWGVTTVMTKWFSASRFWEVATKHDATIVGCMIGPLMVALTKQPLTAAGESNQIRVTSTGSGQVPRADIELFKERFGIELLEIYGQTETGPLGAVGQRRDDNPHHSLGKSHGWCEANVFDDLDRPCEPDEQGQIVMRPTVPFSFLLGYHNQADKYHEATRNLWFHTGDLGHFDANGYLHFDGRMSHSIRRRGENIASLEVESALLRHPDIEECAVVGIEADLGEEDVKAFVVLAAGAEFDPVGIIRFCEEQIAYFKVPRYLERIDTLPRSATKNEVERFKLKELGLGDAWDREAEGVTVKRRV